MNKIIYIIIGIVVVLLALGLWVMDIINKVTYDYTLKGFKINKLNIVGDSVVRVDMQINIKNNNFFGINIKELYYEVFYKGNLLAKSSDKDVNKKEIIIPKKGAPYSFDQSIDVFVNKNSLEVIQNFKNNLPADYNVKVMAKVYGIKINLKNLKITY